MRSGMFPFLLPVAVIATVAGVMMGLANMFGRLAQLPIARRGRINRLPPPLSGWTKVRSFPALASKPFRSRWRKRSRG